MEAYRGIFQRQFCISCTSSVRCSASCMGSYWRIIGCWQTSDQCDRREHQPDLRHIGSWMSHDLRNKCRDHGTCSPGHLYMEGRCLCFHHAMDRTNSHAHQFLSWTRRSWGLRAHAVRHILKWGGPTIAMRITLSCLFATSLYASFMLRRLQRIRNTEWGGIEKIIELVNGW